MTGFAPSVVKRDVVGADIRIRSARSPTRNVDVKELYVETSSSRRDCSLYWMKNSADTPNSGGRSDPGAVAAMWTSRSALP